MSFASDMKTELAKIKIDSCCKMAQLSALLQLNTEIIINNTGAHIVFQTMNNAVARCFISLIKELYSTELNLMTRIQKLTKEKVFMVVVDDAKKIIDETDLFKDDCDEREKAIDNECCKKAYLRGAFLAMGSINNPENSYHLEIKCKNQMDTIFIQRLMNYFDLNAKITKRRNELVVYLKESQSICDFIYIVGASKSFFKYQDIRTNRDLKNDINRKNNCELANEEKCVIAANQQLREIAIIEEKYPIDRIDEKTKEIMDLRKKNPVATYQELLAIYESEYNKKLTKSGLNHRFRKIHEMAISE